MSFSDSEDCYNDCTFYGSNSCWSLASLRAENPDSDAWDEDYLEMSDGSSFFNSTSNVFKEFVSPAFEPHTVSEDILEFDWSDTGCDEVSSEIDNMWLDVSNLPLGVLLVLAAVDHVADGFMTPEVWTDIFAFKGRDVQKYSCPKNLFCKPVGEIRDCAVSVLCSKRMEDTDVVVPHKCYPTLSNDTAHSVVVVDDAGKEVNVTAYTKSRKGPPIYTVIVNPIVCDKDDKTFPKPTSIKSRSLLVAESQCDHSMSYPCPCATEETCSKSGAAADMRRQIDRPIRALCMEGAYFKILNSFNPRSREKEMDHLREVVLSYLRADHSEFYEKPSGTCCRFEALGIMTDAHPMYGHFDKRRLKNVKGQQDYTFSKFARCSDRENRKMLFRSYKRTIHVLLRETSDAGVITFRPYYVIDFMIR